MTLLTKGMRISGPFLVTSKNQELAHKLTHSMLVWSCVPQTYNADLPWLKEIAHKLTHTPESTLR